jgi:hypothetical protein
MTELTLQVAERAGGTREHPFSVERLVNAGYTGRDEAAVRDHIAELEAEGVPAPDRFPTLYAKPSHLLTTADRIEVAGDRTSGEAEFALLVADDEVFVAAGSDHTDRAVERDSIPLAKQVCPNVVGTDAWRLDDVIDHWDALVLRSWTERDGDRVRYQDASVDRIKPPGDLLEFVEERTTGPQAGTALFSGSVATLTEELVCGDRFEVEIYDPELDRRLTCSYDVSVIDWLAS